jgi:hypothetical protein
MQIQGFGSVQRRNPTNPTPALLSCHHLQLVNILLGISIDRAMAQLSHLFPEVVGNNHCSRITINWFEYASLSFKKHCLDLEFLAEFCVKKGFLNSGKTMAIFLNNSCDGHTVCFPSVTHIPRRRKPI